MIRYTLTCILITNVFFHEKYINIKMSYIIMGKMSIRIDDELENKFRTAVFNKLGKKNGHIKEAIEAGIVLWLESVKDKKSI